MKKRAKFHSDCHRLLDEMLRQSVPIQMDTSVDVMAQKFMHDSLPPMLTAEEQLTTIHEQGERWNSTLNRVSNVVELQPDTHIRLLRRHCLRVAEQESPQDGDDDDVIAYYTTDNARSYHDRPLATLGVDKESLPALEKLFTIYPQFVSIDALPLATIEDRITFASTLYEKGLIRTEYELEHSDGDEDQSDSDDDDDADVASKRRKAQDESSEDDDDDDDDEDD